MVLLAGGRVPYILRSVKCEEEIVHKASGTAAAEGRALPAYTFIADAYIQGIVQGELWDEERFERSRLV